MNLIECPQVQPGLSGQTLEFSYVHASTRVGNGHLRARLAQSEAQSPKQPLILAHAQIHAAFLLNPGPQRLAAPKVRGQTDVSRAFAQHPVYPGHGQLRSRIRIELEKSPF